MKKLKILNGGGREKERISDGTPHKRIAKAKIKHSGKMRG